MGPVEDLSLPKRCAAICVYRHDEMLLPKVGFALKLKDEVVVLAHEDSLPELRERWAVPPPPAAESE